MKVIWMIKPRKKIKNERGNGSKKNKKHPKDLSRRSRAKDRGYRRGIYMGLCSCRSEREYMHVVAHW